MDRVEASSPRACGAVRPIHLPLIVLLAVSAGICSAGIWHWVYKRHRAGLPIIPLARRRPVPWSGQDVFFILLLVLLLTMTASFAVQKIAGGEAAAQAAAKELPQPQNIEEQKMEHPAVQLLRTRTPWMIALATVMTVIVAPVFEEFLFRVVLQGWLEAVWSRRRRQHPRLRTAPWASGPIILPALLFAWLHYRTARVPLPPHYVAAQYLGGMAAELALLVVAVIVLRFAVGAKPADLGWQPQKLAADAKLAIVALLAITPVLFLFQGVLILAVKQAGIPIAPDPLPLFLLAIVFGVLYQRTHRITPSLFLHAAFNATSIAGSFLGM
jgi:membrane protease YdiL (CAAX protease family)